MERQMVRFEDRATRRLFADILETLGSEQAKQFSASVKDLFDRKSVSEEGEFDSFEITTADLLFLQEETEHAYA